MWILNNRKVDAIVYTMGKVGSSSISTSIKSAGLHCLDVHFLNEQRICNILQSYFEDPDVEIVPQHIIESLIAHNALVKQGRMKVVTLVRNPIMRNISAVFQNLPPRHNDDFDEILKRLQKYGTKTPDNWFRRDFIPTTGIDIFSAKVDPTSDHFRFSSDKADVLMLKLEAPDDRKEELLRQFVGANVTLERANEARNKGYYEVYKKITEDPNIVRSTFVQDCLKLKYFNKLYSRDDAALLRDRYLSSASP